MREALAIAVAGALEALLAVFAVSSTLPLGFTLLAHGLIVCLSGAIIFVGREPAADVAIGTLILLLLTISGPVGLLPLLAMLPFARLKEIDAVAAWYDRLAQAGKPSIVSQTYEHVIAGRIQNLDARPPVDFLEVIRSGDLDAQQRALGLIARRFHPDYVPVLHAALRSPSAIVRVQAAAVVARVREDLKGKVATLARRAHAPPSKALELAGELRALQGCTLLAEPLKRVCREIGQQHLRQALASGFDAMSLSPMSRDARLAAEEFLIDQRRFKDLRVLRRLGRVVGPPLRVMRRRRGARAEAG